MCRIGACKEQGRSMAGAGQKQELGRSRERGRDDDNDDQDDDDEDGWVGLHKRVSFRPTVKNSLLSTVKYS